MDASVPLEARGTFSGAGCITSQWEFSVAGQGAMNDDLAAIRRVLAADVESFRRLAERGNQRRPPLSDSLRHRHEAVTGLPQGEGAGRDVLRAGRQSEQFARQPHDRLRGPWRRARRCTVQVLASRDVDPVRRPDRISGRWHIAESDFWVIATSHREQIADAILRLGTSALGLFLVVIVMTVSLVVTFCLAAPELGPMVRPLGRGASCEHRRRHRRRRAGPSQERPGDDAGASRESIDTRQNVWHAARPSISKPSITDLRSHARLYCNRRLFNCNTVNLCRNEIYGSMLKCNEYSAATP